MLKNTVTHRSVRDYSRVRDYTIMNAIEDIADVYKKTVTFTYNVFFVDYIVAGKFESMLEGFGITQEEFIEKASVYGFQPSEAVQDERCSAVTHFALSLYGGAKEHRQDVQDAIRMVVTELISRGRMHDLTKLGEAERPHYARVNGKRDKPLYGSAEYYATLEELRPALEHHYACNRHHPEHHKPASSHAAEECFRVAHALETMSQEEVIPPYTGVSDLEWAAEALTELGNDLNSRVSNMNLFDLIEMFCDWQAVSSANGSNLCESIAHSRERYHINPQLAAILVNTVSFFKEKK